MGSLASQHVPVGWSNAEKQLSLNHCTHTNLCCDGLSWQIGVTDCRDRLVRQIGVRLSYCLSQLLYNCHTAIHKLGMILCVGSCANSIVTFYSASMLYFDLSRRWDTERLPAVLESMMLIDIDSSLLPGMSHQAEFVIDGWPMAECVSVRVLVIAFYLASAYRCSWWTAKLFHWHNCFWRFMFSLVLQTHRLLFAVLDKRCYDSGWSVRASNNYINYHSPACLKTFRVKRIWPSRAECIKSIGNRQKLFCGCCCFT